MARPSRSRNLDKTLEIEKRRKQVLALRRTGMTVVQVAETLGVVPSVVSNDLKASLKAAAQHVDARDMVQLELERLDRMMLAVWKDAVGGDDKKIATVLKIMERRARYLGLDAEPEGDKTAPVQIIVNPQMFPPSVQENLVSPAVVNGEIESGEQ